VCIEGHCTPMWYTTVLSECSCSSSECGGRYTLEYHWYCAEGYYSGEGDCPSGTECVKTGETECFLYRTWECTGACVTSGSECTLVNYYFLKAPRVLCGCCP
jgi:hypothetical protein